MENIKWSNYLPLNTKNSAWKRQFLAEQQGVTPKAPAISAEQREIQRLRAENEQLRSDNALLKKCPPSCSRSPEVLCGRLSAVLGKDFFRKNKDN